MESRIAVKIILVISVAGLLFSGYLTYGELIKGTCATGGCSSLLGLPTCLYGFIMYLSIFIISWIGSSTPKAKAAADKKEKPKNR